MGLFVLVPLAIYRTSPDTIAPMHFARETYIRKLVNNGLIPIFVSACENDEMVWQKYEMCSGVLLMGGGDLNCALYGEEKAEQTNITEPERDVLELQIARKSIADRKPILGICRGCQVLAIASGGKLVQHVENHRLENMVYDQLPDFSHVVRVDTGSNLYQLLGRTEIRVNSAHHQAVKEVGSGMKAVGWADDGTVELIEYTDASYFCVGIQSHPEAEENGDLEKIWERFALGITNTA